MNSPGNELVLLLESVVKKVTSLCFILHQWSVRLFGVDEPNRFPGVAASTCGDHFVKLRMKKTEIYFLNLKKIEKFGFLIFRIKILRRKKKP